jgi:3-dehydroquinate synthase
LVAIGGGALLDVAGFAAATAHRGVRLVRLPTTTLSQADSGVGIKNGLNAFGQKNFMGTFAPPFAVINDFNLLATLPPLDKRAGYAEAVKVACIRDAAFFDDIEASAEQLSAFHPPALKRLIYRCAELHLDHIATCGDPFETGSARPLDFGHWAAHKLEMLTRSRLSHGEAVAIGIALDVVYARRLGWLDARSADRILNLLERLGFTLFVGELLNGDSCSHYSILGGLEEFREHLGGDLTVTLLRGIGHAEETHEMQPALILEAVQELRQRAAKNEPAGRH